MEFRNYIEQIPNITIAKRIAAAYVADYRRLGIDEIKLFLEKTAAQYVDAQNIAKSIDMGGRVCYNNVAKRISLGRGTRFGQENRIDHHKPPHDNKKLPRSLDRGSCHRAINKRFRP